MKTEEDMNNYMIQYIDGEDLKFKVFKTDAKNSDEAVHRLWESKVSDFDHRILDVYENGTCLGEYNG